MMDEPDEDFLGEFIGRVCITGHVKGELKDGAGMTAIERGKSVAVAPPKGHEKTLILRQLLVSSGLVGIICQQERFRGFEYHFHGCLGVARLVPSCSRLVIILPRALELVPKIYDWAKHGSKQPASLMLSRSNDSAPSNMPGPRDVQFSNREFGPRLIRQEFPRWLAKNRNYTHVPALSVIARSRQL